MKNEAPKPATILAQADHYIDATTGAVTPPFIAATTFARDVDYAPRLPGVTYSRDGNPTYRQAEQVLAKLEGAAAAMLVPSGIAVGSTLLRSLSAGDHLVIPRVMYHGLREWVHSFSTDGALPLANSIRSRRMRWSLRSVLGRPSSFGSKRRAIRNGMWRISPPRRRWRTA